MKGPYFKLHSVNYPIFKAIFYFLCPKNSQNAKNLQTELEFWVEEKCLQKKKLEKLHNYLTLTYF